MFNNLINIHDFAKFFRKIKRMSIGLTLSKFFYSRSKKVSKQWAPRKNIPIRWGDVPGMAERFNLKISGNPKINYVDYINNKYLKKKSKSNALSIGCGKGIIEVEFAKSKIFKNFEGYDISAEAIKFANKNAKKNKLDKILNFKTVDVKNLMIPKNSFDIIMTFHSLHHFSNLDKLYKQINNALKDDGLFIINEYIGPTRWQWTKRQLEIINAVLSILPKKYRKYYDNNSLKNKEYRPGKLSMILNDPSEAIESSRILPLIEKEFKVIEKKDYGGTILSLLFNEIAFNFIKDDIETKKFIKLCFDIEDTLLETNEIQSDYSVIVCKKKK